MLNDLELDSTESLIKALLQLADSNVDGVTNHDEFKDFIFSQDYDDANIVAFKENEKSWQDEVPNFIVFH